MLAFNEKPHLVGAQNRRTAYCGTGIAGLYVAPGMELRNHWRPALLQPAECSPMLAFNEELHSGFADTVICICRGTRRLPKSGYEHRGSGQERLLWGNTDLLL